MRQQPYCDVLRQRYIEYRIEMCALCWMEDRAETRM